LSELGSARRLAGPGDEVDQHLLRRSHARGALIGALVGDALGSPLAGQPGPVANAAIGSIEATSAVRSFTDDTAMTVGVGESLLFMGGVDQDHLARTLVVRHERRPDRGYGRVTSSLLRRIGAGEDWRQAASSLSGGRGSAGSGAAVRVTPAALWASSPAEAAELAQASAEVTHAHPVAVGAAGVHAAAIHLAASERTSGPLRAERFVAKLLEVASTKNVSDKLVLVLENASASPEATVAAIGNGAVAVEAVPAALCAFLHHADSYPDAVRFAIGLGGDTGTIAAMAGAIAGARLGEAAVPVHWRAYTEGVDEVQQLADRIVTRIHRTPAASADERVHAPYAGAPSVRRRIGGT
jgi:poly(ADP-ribose) glycohydrolase ARH3